MSELPRVLVVEDGHEYIQTLSKYLGAEFEFARAGDGFEAIEQLSIVGAHVEQLLEQLLGLVIVAQALLRQRQQLPEVLLELIADLSFRLPLEQLV